MRARGILLGLIAAMSFAPGAVVAVESERSPPGYDLSTAEAAALKEPIFRRSELTVADTRLLLITRDFGPGLELRDAYLYCWAGDSWGMLAYRRTNSSQVSMRIKSGALELVTKAGRIVLSLPVDSLAGKYDPKEH